MNRTIANHLLRFWGGFAASVAAYAGSLDSLNTRSPFAEEATSSAPAPKADSGLELRSVLAMGSDLTFSVYDITAKQSFWLRLNEPGKTIVAREYDRENEILSVEFNGKKLKVPLKQAKILAQNQPVGASEARPAAVNVGAPAPVASMRPAEEAERLQRVADEVRNRRIARQTGTPPVSAKR